MNSLRTRDSFPLLALLCAFGVFLMTGPFQSMANWGADLTWYWVGAGFTYLLWAAGIALLVAGVMRRVNRATTPMFSSPVLEISAGVLLPETGPASDCHFPWSPTLNHFDIYLAPSHSDPYRS